MSIEKITISETEWKDGQRFEREKEYSRDEYRGDFDVFILENMYSSDVKDFVREQFDLIREQDCPTTYVEDFPDAQLISVLKQRGFDIIKCKTLNDAMKLKNLKEALEL